MSDDMIKGPLLWVLWFVEAAVVLGVATVVPYRTLRGRAFCESCQQWGHRREGVLSVGPSADEDRLRARLALRDLSALEELGPANLNAPQRLRLDLQRCPACDGMHLLSVNRVEVTFKNGQRSEKLRPVVDRLLIGTREVEAVEEIRDRVYGGAPSGETSGASEAGDARAGEDQEKSDPAPTPHGTDEKIGM